MNRGEHRRNSSIQFKQPLFYNHGELVAMQRQWIHCWTGRRHRAEVLIVHKLSPGSLFLQLVVLVAEQEHVFWFPCAALSMRHVVGNVVVMELLFEYKSLMTAWMLTFGQATST